MELKKEKKKINLDPEQVFNLFCIVGLVGILLVGFFVLTKLQEEYELQVIEGEKLETLQLQAVSEELDVPEKNILFVENEDGISEYRTDQGSYLVRFEDAEIKTIIKGESQ